MASADAASAAPAAVATIDRRAGLKRAAVYVTDAQVSGIVDKTVIEKKKKKTQYSFVVFVVWSDGRTTTVWRSYNTIFTFQVDLLGKFPEEAGEKANKDGKRKRIIPFLPGNAVCMSPLLDHPAHSVCVISGLLNFLMTTCKCNETRSYIYNTKLWGHGMGQ